MQEHKYEINGKVYSQRPLVLGQVDPLVKLMETITITELNPMGLIRTLGEHMPRAMAIVLIPEGQKVRDKNIDELEAEFANEMDVDTALEVAADFLSCNPVSSISQKIRQLVVKMWEKGNEIKTG